MTKGSAAIVVALSWVGLSALHALMGGCVFLVIAFVFRTRLFSKIQMLRPLAAASAFTVLEWIESLFWWGMPTARLSGGQTELILGIQTASLFGSFFISFLLVAVNFYLGYALISVLRKNANGDKDLGNVKAPVIAAAAILLFNYAAGAVIWFAGEEKEEKSITVAAIQSNANDLVARTDESIDKIFSDHRKYTAKAAERGADIVLWTETVLPYVLKEDNATCEYISSVAKECGVTVIAGVFTADKDESRYNSQVCFTPDGKMINTVYNKIHLVPYGEYVPLADVMETLFPPVTELISLYGELLAGEDTKVFELEEARVGAVICYDALYDDVTRGVTGKGAEFLAISSNDAWFRDSVYLSMHNGQIKMRAVECGRYALHGANTGISAVFSHRGEEISSLEPLSADVLVERVSLRTNRTLYSYIGNIFTLVCLVFIAVMLVIGVAETVTRRGKFFGKN